MRKILLQSSIGVFESRTCESVLFNKKAATRIASTQICLGSNGPPFVCTFKHLSGIPHAL